MVKIPDANVIFGPPTGGGADVFVQPSRQYQGLPVGGWMLYPTLFVAGAYDSNPYQSSGKNFGSSALRTSPGLVAVRAAGIHNTMLYGAGDLYFYNRDSNINNYSARGGLVHIWEAQRDLIFRFTADASRQIDSSTSGSVLNGVFLRPVYYDSFVGGASVIKSFDRIFVGLGGNFTNTQYENTKTTTGAVVPQAYRDFNQPTASGRLGYFVTPLLYSFVEASGNWMNYYNASTFNSEGYRVTGGLGTDRISLFKGEVYAGYQQQFYRSAAFGVVDAPAFGGKLYWYPTQYLTFAVNVDESIGTATFVSPSNPNGSPTKTTAVGLRAEYALAEAWSAVARGGYSYVDYVNNTRVDNTWNAGATLNYKIWRNLSATFDYQFAAVVSNYAAASYTRNIVSLGATYRY